MGTATNPYAPHTKAAKAAQKAQEPAEEQTPAVEEVDPEAVPEGPAAEVLKWVGDDSERAKKAYDAEEAGQQRVGLSKKLKELF